MTEQLLDVVSETTPNGYPVYEDCTLILGDIKVVFHHGRARVPASAGALVSRNSKLRVFQSFEAPVQVAPEGPSSEGVSLERAGDVAFGPNGDPKTPADLIGDPDAVDLAKEYLNDLPEDERPLEAQEPPAPQGPLERTTGDGQERCQARRTDGVQCANKALEGGSACGLPKHREQLGLGRDRAEGAESHADLVA
jgi:hypothetical protein